MSQNEQKLDLRRYWLSIVRFKWVFIALMALFVFAGIFFSVRSLPKYKIEGDLLVGELGQDSEGAGEMSQMMRSFSVGGIGSSAVDNEVLIMDSHDVMLRMVRALGVNRTYIAKNSDGDRMLLYNNSPVIVDAPVAYFDTLSTPFTIKIEILDSGKVNLKAQKGFFKRTIAEKENVELPTMFITPLGSLQVMATEDLKETDITTIHVSVGGNDQLATLFSKSIKISAPEKLANVIRVEYNAGGEAYGKAVVNGVMNEYNAKRLDRLHTAAEASIKYYDERIAEAFEVLQKAEKEASEYQRKNSLMGIDSELGLLVNTAVSNRQAIQTAHYNIAYYETVLDILRNRLNDDVIIPEVESLSDPHVGEFNGAILTRRDLRRSATEENTALQLLNEKILRLRDIIIENSEKKLAKSKADIRHQEELTAKAQNRLDDYPDYQLELKNILRNREYQNALYQYLVRSRQSSVLRLYSSTNLGWVYQPAYVAKAPSILQKCIMPAIFIFLGLFCGCGLAMLLTWLRRKVVYPADLAKMKLEQNCVTYSGEQEQLNRMRSLLTANDKRRLIYTVSITGSDITPLVAEPLLNIGRAVEILSGAASNDELLTPVMQSKISTALDSADYVIVEVPQPYALCDLEHEIDRNDAQIVIGLESNAVARTALKNILIGQTASRVFTFLFRK